MNTDTKDKAQTRVTATVYGVVKHGSVARDAGRIVWVRWDGEARDQWMHRTSLTFENAK